MMQRLLLIVLLVAATAAAVLALQEKRRAELAAMSRVVPPPAAISVATVKAEKWRQTLFSVGTLVADQGVQVAAPLEGSVIEIMFDSGQTVRRGEPLLKMDVGVQLAELDGLKASRELRRTQFERAKKLLRDKQISQSDYDAARAGLDEAQAVVDAKHAYIVRKTVYAPFAGELGIRLVNLGTYLEPGDPIVPLQALDPIHVDYSLPEQHLQRLNIGQPVEIAVAAFPGEVFWGHITAFNPGVDPGTRSLRIRATVQNADRRLRPGMFAEVSTVERQPRAVLTLPQTAVTYSAYGESVYVVNTDADPATIERRQVKTGEMRSGRIEIAAGLDTGDVVVAVGQNKLRSGQAVAVTETFESAGPSVRP